MIEPLIKNIQCGQQPPDTAVVVLFLSPLLFHLLSLAANLRSPISRLY